MPALLFLAYFVAEIATLVVVGHFLGVFPTILLLLAGSAVVCNEPTPRVRHCGRAGPVYGYRCPFSWQRAST
ncbi:hypothetical protein ACWELQ_45225, partial [Nocardia sp. NPDC004722]